MTRKKGSFNMSANVEPRLAAPFDARQVVPAKSDLTDAANFQFSYLGMIVSVQAEGTAYILTGADTTDINNWKALGEGTTITIDDAMSDTSENAVQNKVITGALADKADKTELGDYYTKTEADGLLDAKQDKLTAGENITITYDATTQETTIASTGGSGGTVGEDITTNIAVGGLASGSSIDKDDTITSVLKRMLVTTYFPTFTPPSASVTYNAPALAKVGSNIAAMAASVVFNAGAIMLQGTKQADRAGAATNYSIATSGAATEYSDSNTTGSFNMPALTRNSKGNITITGTVDHEAGPQPKDSDGNDYGSPLAAGSVTATKTVEFILPFYFGVSNGMTVTDFTGFTELLEKKGQKQYTYVTNNQHFVIAYDASYGDLTSILDPNNFETKGSWTKSTLTVDGQQYNVYVAQTATTNPGAKYTFKF